MVLAVRESLPAEDSVYGFLSIFDTIFLLDDISPVKPVTKALPLIQEAISKKKECPSISSYGLDVGLDELATFDVFFLPDDVKPVTKALPWIQETISKNIGDYLSILSYGLDVGPVKPMRKTTLKDFGDYPSIPSDELDVAPVKSVTDAFAWIQEIIFKNIGDYPSIPSHKLDVGLVKPLTNVFAWIEGGIDAIDNIVSLFHWGYKQGSAIVGGKAIVSENPELFLIDPNATVLSKLLAAIDIGGDLATKSIDNCFDVKTKAHGEPTPISFEVIA